MYEDCVRSSSRNMVYGVSHIPEAFDWTNRYSVVHRNDDSFAIVSEYSSESACFSRFHHDHCMLASQFFSNELLIRLAALRRTFQSTKTRTEDVIVRIPNMLMFAERRESLILATTPGLSSNPMLRTVTRAIPILAASAIPCGSFRTASCNLAICCRSLSVCFMYKIALSRSWETATRFFPAIFEIFSTSSGWWGRPVPMMVTDATG